ncbi:MAG: ComEC/Rec2 family competence protein [Alloprevotella sp.]|nr:ComEC/Rec2 family competence protein [Alloprevotella sp.]
MSQPFKFNDILRENPLLIIAIFLAVGISLSSLIPPEYTRLAFYAMAGGVALCISALIYCLSRRPNHTALFAFLLIASSCSIGALNAIHNSTKQHFTWNESRQTYAALITSVDKETAKTWRVTCQVDGRTVLGVLLKDTTRLQPADSILFNARISQPKNQGNPGEFDYASYLKRHNYSGTYFCYANQWTKIGQAQPRIFTSLWFQLTRMHLVKKYKAFFTGQDLAVISSLTLGDRSLLESETRSLFSQTGSAHVIALSGFHLSVIIGIFNFIIYLFVSSRRWRTVCGLLSILFIIGFVFLAGAPVSLIRAAVMAILFQILMLLQRDIFPLNTLALTAILFFLFSPDTLYDVGFQLSFAAMVGIYVILPRIPQPAFIQRYKLARLLYGIFTISLAAQVGTLPLVAYHFHRIPVYSLLTSFIIYPFAYIILLGALLFFLLPFLQAPLALIIGRSTNLMLSSLEKVALLPSPTLSVSPSALQTFLIYTLLFIIVAQTQTWGRKLRLIILLLLLIGASEVGYRTLHPLEPQLVLYNNTAPTIHIIPNRAHSFLWTPSGSPDKTAQQQAEDLLITYHDYTPATSLSIPTQSDSLFCDEHLVMAGPNTIVIPTEHLSINTLSTDLHADVLYITKAFNGPLDTLCKQLHPKVVVFNRNLPEWKLNKYLGEIRSYPVKIHLLANDGAYILPLK